MINKSTFQNFVADLPRNIFSGFVVSLIALPLGLGLAIASGAPPMAGIISAIVGGSVVALLGGSNLTITGPGNGLVIVVLSAILTLGEGDNYQGYLFTLAAIIISGLILVLFGVFRLGSLSEFFPSSALQGMLAAIGIGILATQVHVMFGIASEKGSALEQISNVPKTILYLLENPTMKMLLGAIIGCVSLIFMFIYSKIRIPFFHLIPAPMWVVIGSIGVVYYYEMFLNSVAPLSEDLMIRLPENFLGEFPAPNFTKVLNIDFIGFTLSITLVAFLESLLSIKAVDKLDPKKRRSNMNKDLRALGLATIASGFLGGLNVVTVIARSSVNVNNGGTNRSANFFHALFLLLFILLFVSQIQKIPLPALAAILVYTGYRLAAPENFIRIYKIGKEQAFIFLVTLFGTLLTDLITGIGLGILCTFIVHLFLNNSFVLFSRNWLKPNVLMYLEEESGNYYVSVKNFCSFLNFFKLKKKLDEIPETEHAIVDFSLCDFVDHTVMEGLNSYRRSFASKGGILETIGLDIRTAETSHPFAVRKSSPQSNFLNFKASLTKRQVRLQKLSTILDWEYLAEPISDSGDLEKFLFFKTKLINYQYNSLNSKNNITSLFDLSYSEGAFIAKENLEATFLKIKSPNKLPVFVLDKENLMSIFYSFSRYKDINFKQHPVFSNRFFLYGEDRKAIRSLFSSDLISFFESQPTYHVESNGRNVLIKGGDRLASIEEIKKMMAFAEGLGDVLSKKGS